MGQSWVMIVRTPFVEVIRYIVPSGVGSSVFEVYDDVLTSAYLHIGSRDDDQASPLAAQRPVATDFRTGCRYLVSFALVQLTRED
jgi:hypothetical protein